METYTDENKTEQMLKSREDVRICMSSEAYQFGAPMGIIWAVFAEQFVRFKPTLTKSIVVLVSGLCGYTFGRSLYIPVCLSKYMPELQEMQQKRSTMRSSTNEIKANESEMPWIEQEPILNDYYTNTDDNRNKFEDISNDSYIDDKPINLKQQKQSVTYEYLRRQHRASLQKEIQRERPRLHQNEELLDDVTTLKNESTEENIWF